MKKLLSISIVMILLLPTMAFADVLSVTWENSSLEELREAQLMISNKISEILAEAAPSVDAIEISGQGTSIKAIEVPFSPSRVTLLGTGEVKITGGSYDFKMESHGQYMSEMMDETGSLTALIEAKGEWTLKVEPIKHGAVLPMNGTGPFVSDFFDLIQPMIVTIKASGSKMKDRSSNLIVRFVHQYENISSWRENGMTNEIIRKKDNFEVDVIISPVEGRSEYLFQVYCQPGVEWSITPKQ